MCVCWDGITPADMQQQIKALQEKASVSFHALRAEMAALRARQQANSRKLGPDGYYD